MPEKPRQHDEEEGTVPVVIKNEINGRSNVEIRVNPDWTMERVRDRAYQRTKDDMRPNDRFTCQDENKVINGELLQRTFADVTGPSGPCAGERHFFIRGPVGGA